MLKVAAILSLVLWIAMFTMGRLYRILGRGLEICRRAGYRAVEAGRFATLLE